jgi:hypothetical protein
MEVSPQSTVKQTEWPGMEIFTGIGKARPEWRFTSAMNRIGGLNPKTEIEPQISQIDTDFEAVAETILKPV